MQPRLFLELESLEERVLPALPSLPPYLLVSDCSCSCNDPGDLIAPQRGLVTPPAGSPGSGASSYPVRYFDGVVKIVGRDLESDGYGVPWGQTRSWTNGVGYAVNTTNGNGWVVTQQPYLRRSDAHDVVVPISNGTTARFFDLGAVGYRARAYYQDQLTDDTTNHVFVLTDSAGDKISFYDFDASYWFAGRSKVHRVLVVDVIGGAGCYPVWRPGIRQLDLSFWLSR